MVNYNDAIDLIRRRAVMHMEKDAIQKCYLTLLEDSCVVTLVSKCNLNSSDIAKIKMRYARMFDDQACPYIVEVLSCNSYSVQTTTTTFEIWDSKLGFRG